MNTPAITRMGLAEWTLLLLLSLIWGGSFFFNAVALQGLPPMLVVLGRVFVGALGLLAIIRVAGLHLAPYRHRWRQFLILSLLNTTLPFSLIVWGQQHIDSGLAAVINATTPAFTILVTHFYTSDEHASLQKIIGAIIGLGGVMLLIGTDAVLGFGDHVLGQLAVLGATFCYACAATYTRRMTDMPPMITGFGQLSASTLTLAPIAITVSRPWELPMPDLNVIGAIICLGLICSAFAYVLFFRILTNSGATNVSLVTLFIPLSATALGVAFLNEPFTLRIVWGMACVTTAAILINGYFKRKRSPG